MKQIISSREAYEKYNEILTNVILQLREYIGSGVVDFSEQSFEDMAGNDLCAIDEEKVYIGSEYEEGEMPETYPLHELDLLDAIKILGDFESGVIAKTEEPIHPAFINDKMLK